MFTGVPGSEASARTALARARVSAAPVELPCESFSLVVDLASEPLGPRWIRGAATLALLCSAALSMTPGVDPFSTAAARTISSPQTFQMNAMLVPAQSQPMSAQQKPEPAIPADPEEAAKPVIASDSSAVRIQGAVTEGLYWSLRDAGVPSKAAADYLHALSTRIDVGADVAPYDRFDVVISKSSDEPLVYAALHRVDGPDVQLLKWNSGGGDDWFDTDASAAQRSDGLMAPVAGRITSGFGVRYHPILHFARMHSGIDFGAAWGSPIVAAADGQVIATGWSGGYGRQVRVAHSGGIVTTYSHMSSIAASPGEIVRQGQVIGYVGSSGLSTGPHLHFEVRFNGQAVDPTGVRLQSRKQVGASERQAFNARLKRILSIGQSQG